MLIGKNCLPKIFIQNPPTEAFTRANAYLEQGTRLKFSEITIFLFNEINVSLSLNGTQYD